MKEGQNKKLRIIIIFILTFLVFWYIFGKSDSKIQTNTDKQNITEYIGDFFSQNEYDFKVPEELKQNVNFWKNVFINTSIYSVIYYTPKDNIKIKQIDSSLDFSIGNEDFFNISLVSGDEKIAKYSVFDLIDRDKMTNILQLDSVREKIDEIYDDLNEKLHKNDTIKEEENIGYTRGRKEKFEDAWRYSGKFIEKVKKVFKDQDIPEKLAYLSFTESSFKPYAVSASNAVGIFQIIPSTARRYGLIVNSMVDERRDPILQASATAKYLKELYEEFGSWLFAVNAYHSGEHNLRRALEWAEKYYPEKPDEFTGTLSDYQYIKVTQEFPDDEEFNTGELKYGVQSARYTTLYLAFLESVETLKSTVNKNKEIDLTAVKISYNNDYVVEKQITVKSGDTLSGLAYDYGVSVEYIKKWNNIDDSFIRAGDVLTIFVEEPPISFQDIFEGLNLNQSEKLFMRDYNFSYAKENESLEIFSKKRILSDTTINIMPTKDNDLRKFLSNY